MHGVIEGGKIVIFAVEGPHDVLRLNIVADVGLGRAAYSWHADELPAGGGTR